MRFLIFFSLLALPCLGKRVRVPEDPTSDKPHTQNLLMGGLHQPERVDIVAPYVKDWGTWVPGPNYVFNKTFDPPYLGNGTERLPIVKAAEAFARQYGPPSFRFVKKRSSIQKDGISYLHFVTRIVDRDVPERWFIVQMASNRSVISYEKRMDLQPHMQHRPPAEIISPMDALRIAVDTLYLDLPIKRNAKAVPREDSTTVYIHDHNVADRYIVGRLFDEVAHINLESITQQNGEVKWFWEVMPRDWWISPNVFIDITTGEIKGISIIEPIVEKFPTIQE